MEYTLSVKTLTLVSLSPKGDGNAIMEILNEIEDYTDPNATFTLTEKGKKMTEKIASFK